jgi:hypothetical protein
MFPLRKYILYSTLLTVFSDRLFVTIGVNLYAAYLIVVLNLILLWRVESLWFPKGLLFFIGYIFVSGVIGLATGSNSWIGFSKDFIGIVPNAIYICAFLRFMKFDYELCFELYAKWAYYVAILGLIFLPFQIFGGDRLTSVLIEPSAFCLVCGPALYYYADRWLERRQHGWRVIILLLALILTGSSLGYMGILFGIYLLGTRYRIGILLAPILVAFVALFIYSQSKMFQQRFDDTVGSLSRSDLSGVNLSTYGIVSNIFVTERAFGEHPLIGGGLGSYVVDYDRFANELIGITQYQMMGMGSLSRWDASSLLLRVVAEFGILGILLSIWFLIRYWPRNSTPNRRIIAKAILCFIFMKIVRSGAYFNPETFFFLVGYAINGIVARMSGEQSSRLTLLRPPPFESASA